jgi:hypothetical protein
LKKATDNIYKELENKLDRLELEALKEYIEKTMRKLRKLQVKFKTNRYIHELLLYKHFIIQRKSIFYLI